MFKRPFVIVASFALLLAACQFGNAEPAARNAPPGTPHRTLLMVGDSLMGQHDAVFPQLLAGHGFDVTVIDAHVNGTGLIGPVGDADSALAWVQDKVAEHPDADPVVLEWAGNCVVCGTTVDGVTYPALGDIAAGFYDLWLKHAYEIIDWLHGQGKTVIWTVSPPLGFVPSPGILLADVSRWLSIFDGILIGPHTALPTVDWMGALSDTNGQYATTLWYNNQFNTVRTPDLIHFTDEGARRAATWTLSVLDDLLPLLPAPAASTASLPTGLIEAGDPVRLPSTGGI